MREARELREPGGPGETWRVKDESKNGQSRGYCDLSVVRKDREEAEVREAGRREKYGAGRV